MVISRNLRALLDTIAWSEQGDALLAASDRGYNVIVGSTASKLHLFTSYADHPRVLVDLGHGMPPSTAAGRYQTLEWVYDAYKTKLHLNDFSPPSQDSIAIQQLREKHALGPIDAGHFADAVYAIRNLWASLPGNTYNQHPHTLDDLIKKYTALGGVVVS